MLLIFKCMPKGGARPNSGKKSTWNYGETTTVRVPKALAEYLKSIARKIDQGEQPFSPSEKSIDFSGIAMSQIDGELAVKLVDLVKAGYEINPDDVRVMVNARIKKMSITKRG